MPGEGPGRGCEGEDRLGRQAGGAGPVRGVPEEGAVGSGERDGQGQGGTGCLPDCQRDGGMLARARREERDGGTGDGWRQAEMGR